MDSSDVSRITIIIVLLLLSAFFSSAETCLTTANKIRIKSLCDENVRGAATVYKLLENPTSLLSTILIGNNIVNLTASSMTTTFAMHLCKKAGFGDNASVWVSIATGILTIVVLIFGEIVPKSVAAANANRLALWYGGPIYALTVVLRPIVYIMNKLSSVFLLLFRIDSSASPTITESELLTIVDVSHEEGVLKGEEREMINNVVDFGDSMVKDVMIPKMDVEFVSIDVDYNGLIESYSKEKYTRMPVYKETRDNIVGIINLKDIFFYTGNHEELRIEEVMREAYFTYEYKKASELFFEMRENYIPMAIVLDEYGSTAGIITMEDLVEQIVGDLRDEYDDDEEDPVTKFAEDEYLALGVAKLEEINDMTGLHLESDDYDSIAGHIINLLEHMPSKKETVCDDFAEYTILELKKNRIDKIHIHVFPQNTEETAVQE